MAPRTTKKKSSLKSKAPQPARRVDTAPRRNSSAPTDRHQGEGTLSQIEEQLRLLIEHAPAALAMFDSDMRYLAVSRRWRNDYHLGDQLIVGRSHYEIFPEIPDRWKDVYRRGLSGEVVSEKVDRFERADGSVQWLQWEVRPWRMPDDLVGGIVIFSEDITERVRAEEQLRESEVRFRALVESTGDVFWISDPRNRKLIYVSQAFAGIWGRTPDALYEHFETWLDAIHTDDRERIVQNFFSNILTGTYDAEYRVVRPDGSIRWIHDRRKPLGIGTLVAGVAEDITQRKEIEAVLKEREERLRHVLEKTHTAVWDWDIRCGKVFWTPQHFTMLGYEPDSVEPSYANWAARVHPEDLVSTEAAVREAMEQHCEYRHEFRALWSDGTVRWIDAHGTYTYGPDGRCERMVGVMRDITERKQAQEALRESEAKFRKLFENMTEMFQILEPIFDGQGKATDFRYVEVNPATETLTGKSRKEIEGKTAKQLWGIVEDYWVETMAEVLRTGKSAHTENYSRELDAYLDMKTWQLDDHRVAIAISNVTERHRAEAVSREYEARNRFITERAGVGYWYWDIAQDRLEWSSLCKQLFGIPVDEPMSYARFLAALHPDDRNPTDHAVHTCLESAGMQGYDIECRTQWPDGTVRWIHAKGSATFEQGRPVRMAGIALDITDYKQAELSLQKNEAFIAEVLNSLSAHVCVLDRNGVILRTNEPWERFSRANSDMTSTIGAVGENYLEVCRRAIANGDTTVGPILAGIEAVIEGRAQMFSAEYPCDSPEETRWFLLRASPLVASQGVVLSHLDISDRKLAENALILKQQQLERSQEKLEDLTGKLFTAQDGERQRIARDLHDDFCQRLAAVAINVASLQRKPPLLPELIGKALEPIREELEELANDLHDVAYRLHPPLLRHLGLQAAIEDYLHKAIERTGLPITLRVKDVPSSIPLDWSICLFRVLQESLQNVVKHAVATEVQVRLSGSSKGIGLSVIDNGKGFDAQDEATHLKGLGLSSMQERLRLLNGFLNIHSRPMKGTKVCAWIPFRENTL